MLSLHPGKIPHCELDPHTRAHNRGEKVDFSSCFTGFSSCLAGSIPLKPEAVQKWHGNGMWQREAPHYVADRKVKGTTENMCSQRQRRVPRGVLSPDLTAQASCSVQQYHGEGHALSRQSTSKLRYT